MVKKRGQTMKINTNNLKVCLNEICDKYARESCDKFQENFKHCPFCGGQLTTQSRAMLILERNKN